MDPITALADDVVIGLTLYGEARGEGPEGRIAVANVIRNRAQQRKLTPRAVCLQPLQFSCWNEHDPNRDLLLATAAAPSIGPLVRECRWIAQGLIADAFVDNTHGATHYLTLALLESHPPSWAKGQRVLTTIGHHAFMRVA